MNYRQALIAVTLASGLGACATTTDYGLSYQGGSYYSPAAEGRGDYYVGPDFQRSYYLYDDYDLFFGRSFGGWYDSPFYSYGGYCSVRYRYCPRWAWGGGFGSPYGETGFQIYFGSPWDPYWGRDYYPRRPYRSGRPGPGASGDTQTRGTDGLLAPRPADSRRQRPRPRPEPISEDGRGDSDAFPFPSTGKGRRASFPRPSEPAPTRSPRPKSDGGDGN
jgi:hypothetical protein